MLYLILLVFVLIGGGLTVITIENLLTPVHLALFMWQTPTLPLGLLLLVFFLVGALLLYLVSFLSALSDKREMTSLRKRVTQLEQQGQTNRPITGPLPSSTSILQMPGMYNPPRN